MVDAKCAAARYIWAAWTDEGVRPHMFRFCGLTQDFVLGYFRSPLRGFGVVVKKGSCGVLAVGSLSRAASFLHRWVGIAKGTVLLCSFWLLASS